MTHKIISLMVVIAFLVAVPVNVLRAQSKTDDPAASERSSEPEIPARQVRRSRRPEFKPDDGKGVFFDDLFAEALQGPRPETSTAPTAATVDEPATADSGESTGDQWSSVVAGSVLEDEIKRQQIRLNSLVTNPGQFKTRNADVRESFQVVALMFAIISKYDDQVRWQDQAESAVTALNAAASLARKPDLPAFEGARETTRRLTDLVRGGNFGSEPNAKPVTDWSAVIDRSAIMERLEHNVSESLKSATASKDEFADQAETILHEAAIIAAMGRVLQLPELLDADDEGYRELSDAMIVAARELSAATSQNNYEAALTSLNKINQACANCHEEWR